MFEENILIVLININPWNLTLYIYMYVWSISLHIHKKAITPFIFQEEDCFFFNVFLFCFSTKCERR